MSKELLSTAIHVAKEHGYAWNLYFFKISHRKKGNPYYVYKIKFKNVSYLPEYALVLCDAVSTYQIGPLENVQEYDGMNSKTSCDKIKVNNELLSEQWNYFFTSVSSASREEIKGKYQGYILDGQPTDETDKPITVVKIGNPLFNLENKKSVVFKHVENDELDQFSDDLCRLYLKADFLVISDTLYAFNHAFEGIFDMEKTMRRLKDNAIENIMATNAFRETEKVTSFMKSYTSPKTFLTLKQIRVDKLSTQEGRQEIANRLQLNTTGDSEIIVDTQEQANQLIKYLCYKIFQDKETDHLIEVTSILNDNILSH
ncbi:hypothetical protein JCM17380_35060 [Desulfosporosinus burensis]